MRDAAKHPMVHGMVPTVKNDPAHNSAEVEEP